MDGNDLAVSVGAWAIVAAVGLYFLSLLWRLFLWLNRKATDAGLTTDRGVGRAQHSAHVTDGANRTN